MFYRIVWRSYLRYTADQRTFDCIEQQADCKCTSNWLNEITFNDVFALCDGKLKAAFTPTKEWFSFFSLVLINWKTELKTCHGRVSCDEILIIYQEQRQKFFFPKLLIEIFPFCSLFQHCSEAGLWITFCLNWEFTCCEIISMIRKRKTFKLELN